MKTTVISLLACCLVSLTPARASGPEIPPTTPSNWYYPEWVASSPYNLPVRVLDTDSALGRYSLAPKEIGLQDIVRFHGHLCDGLVIAYVEIRVALGRLFPDGIVDRTDLRAVTKNGPCWVDTVMFMTGARINFQTLRVDNAIGDGFIVQRISTGEAYEVRLKPGVFPENLAALEQQVVAQRQKGEQVSAADIDALETQAAALIRKLLAAAPEEFVTVLARPRYDFKFNDLYGNRRDVINKDMPRR